MPALAVLTLVSAASSIYSGFAGKSAYDAEGNLQRQQADIAASEAQINAKNEAFNQTQAVQNQRLAFLANGVTLEGSPALVLEESKKYGQGQVDAILRQGAARKALGYAEADISKNKGRAALIGGFTQAAGSIAQGIGSGAKAGMFDSGGNTSDADVYKASIARPGTRG
jgi:hypothetical protein